MSEGLKIVLIILAIIVGLYVLFKIGEILLVTTLFHGISDVAKDATPHSQSSSTTSKGDDSTSVSESKSHSTTPSTATN